MHYYVPELLALRFSFCSPTTTHQMPYCVAMPQCKMKKWSLLVRRWETWGPGLVWPSGPCKVPLLLGTAGSRVGECVGVGQAG